MDISHEELLTDLSSRNLLSKSVESITSVI